MGWGAGLAATSSSRRSTSSRYLSLACALHHTHFLSGIAGREAARKLANKKWRDKGLPGPEPRFEQIIRRQRKAEYLFRLRELLSTQPEQVIQMDDLGKMRREVGIVSKTRKVSTLVRSFPSVFQFYTDEEKKTWCGFTTDAETLFEEEKTMLENYKPVLVMKLRKLLMLSVNNRLLVNKLAHMRKYFGLPSDFQESLLEKHPEFFRLDEINGRLYVELTSWDPSLAISALERRVKQENNGTKGKVLRYPLAFKKGYNPRKKRLDEIEKFQLLPYISPYQNAADFEVAAGSLEAEEFAVAVIHELLSLTIEKQAVVEQLGQFRQEYRLLVPRLMSLLQRHHGIFYAMPKKPRSIVFLKEGFKGTTLIDTCPLVQWKERFFEFAKVRNCSRQTISEESNLNMKEMIMNDEINDDDEDEDVDCHSDSENDDDDDGNSNDDNDHEDEDDDHGC